jgi:hypothetical protein
MSPTSLAGAAALLLLGGGAAAAFILRGASAQDADPELLALAREIRALETAKPDAVIARSSGDKKRAWTRDARESEFNAPPVVAEFAWFADGAMEGIGRTIARSDHALRLGRIDDPIHFWYLRNSVDRARMSGVEVQHGERLLVEYPESDLEDQGLGTSWAALSRFGVGLDAFASLARTGEAEEAFGIRFERWARDAAAPAAEGEPLEIWWSGDWALPLRVLRLREGRTVEQRLIALERALDPELAKSPALRWPEYQVMDVADYREGLHEHAGGRHDEVHEAPR